MLAPTVTAIVERAQRAYDIPRISVVVVRNGRIVYERDSKRRYQIGSVTKEIVAAETMSLIDARRLSPATPIRTFLGPAADPRVTVLDLLNQRSGIADYNRLTSLARIAIPIAMGTITPAEITRVILSDRLAFTPGSRFAYSNSNYILLGEILQDVTRESAPRLLARAIFGPLAMQQTSLSTSGICGDGAACGHTKTPFGVRTTRPWSMNLTYTAGGITSTARDVALFDIAVMSARRFAAWRRALETSTLHYSYGAHLYRDAGRTVAWQDGTVIGFKAMNSMIFPDRDAVIVLTNADYAHAAVVAMQIERAAFGLPGGDGEPIDPSLPHIAYPLAIVAGLAVYGLLLVLGRSWAIGAVIALITYACSLYIWQAALAAYALTISITIWLYVRRIMYHRRIKQ